MLEGETFESCLLLSVEIMMAYQSYQDRCINHATTKDLFGSGITIQSKLCSTDSMDADRLSFIHYFHKSHLTITFSVRVICNQPNFLSWNELIELKQEISIEYLSLQSHKICGDFKCRKLCKGRHNFYQQTILMDFKVELWNQNQY